MYALQKVLLVIDMQQIRCILACFVLLALASSALAREGGLRVGLADDYPPLCYVDGAGRRHGFEYDLARDLCRQLGRSCVWTFTTQEKLLEGLRDGSLDMIFAQRRGAAGQEDLLYSRAYYHSRPMCIGRPDGPDPGTPGVRIGVHRGSPLELWAGRSWPGAVIRSGSVGEMIQRLRAGDIDILFVNDLVGYAFLLTPEGQPFDRLNEPVIVDRKSFGSRVAVRRDRPELLDAVDKGLKALLYSGELHNRSRKYFQFIIY